MKTYQFEDFHSVDAAVVFCVDPRFWRQTIRFVEEELGIQKFDPYTYPGGPLCLIRDDSKELFYGLIEAASLKLHEAKKIILISHAGCGGYKLMEGVEGDAAIERQTADINQIKADFSARFPEVEISSFFLQIVSANEVAFKEVK